MAIAIKVENISKAYQLGLIGTGTLSRDIERWYSRLRGKEDPFLKIGEANDRSVKGTSDIVWSLKDISFDINEGDAVGIIGRNGAGKSTLLKILSRVTSPTIGNIKVKGRIASLLEVGTGFHPELTGKENIYLNGAILGMRKKEITRKFDEIVDFSGVERYIDTPVKRYSSGMYVRLAFAVATHLESDILIVDEVHKYPLWLRELKNIYDGLPEMKVIFSASSALDIYRGESDLSRRVISYSLAGLSFREYITFMGGPMLPSFTLQGLQKDHRKLSNEILAHFQPLPFFKKYLINGYLPIIAEGENEYLPKLEQVVNTIVDTDLAYIASYNAGTAVKVKKLLAVIAESVPFKPNISALARKLDIHRDSIYEYIYQLNDAKLLNILSAEGKGVSRLQKPDKIYLENTNLSYAISHTPDKVNIRETFLLNQLINLGLEVFAPPAGDFSVSGITIEVGGKSKTTKQVKEIDNYLIAADDIETGFGSKIPLWMFGFLY